MKIFLTSYLSTHIKDENGNRIPLPIPDENQIVTNLKKSLGGTRRLVYVANDPHSLADNKEKIFTVVESFHQTGLAFTENILLDKRNQKHAKEIIANADLIILSGGKCRCQNRFLRKIKMQKLLRNYHGVVIGISAGSMNLGQIVANFPEDLADLKEPRWLKGLGLVDMTIIPHFDGTTKTYQIPCEDFDITHDYIFPMSHKTAFLAIPNDSYLIIDAEQKTHFYGPAYTIKQGVVTKIPTKKSNLSPKLPEKATKKGKIGKNS